MKSRRSVLPHEVLHQDRNHFRAAPLPRLPSSPLLHGPYRSIRDDRQLPLRARWMHVRPVPVVRHKRRSCEFDGRRNNHRAASTCLPPAWLQPPLPRLYNSAINSMAATKKRGMPTSLGALLLGGGIPAGMPHAALTQTDQRQVTRPSLWLPAAAPHPSRRNPCP